MEKAAKPAVKPVTTKATNSTIKPVASTNNASTNSKPLAVVANQAKISGSKPSETVVKKPVATTATKINKAPAATVKKATGTTTVKKAPTAGTGDKKVNSGTNIQKVPEPVKAQLPPPPPPVPAMNIQNINLKQLVEKIEVSRDNNRSLLIIDKLEFNDSYTFFKYKGSIVDVPRQAISEQLQKQTHEKSIEDARKLTVHSVKVGDFLVFAMDQSLRNIQEFYSGSSFFSPKELFVPKTAITPQYFRQKLITPEEDVDGFGNKGNFYPNDNFIALIHTKSTDQPPEELLKTYGVPVELFDVLIIS